MNYSVFRFTLNMHNHRSQVSVPVFVGDTGVRLLISITDGGNPYFIEDGCTAYIRGKKPDGNPIFNQCLILNNTTIQYDLTEQTTVREGIVTCEIDLYGADGTLITAPKFIIVVDSKSVPDSTIINAIEESHPDVGILPKIIATIESEDARVEAENVRKANELVRQEEEAKRQEAEAQREADRLTFEQASALADSIYASASTVNEAANRVETIKSGITRNSKRITNLEKGIVPNPFETDLSVAYIKEVPEDALPYAEISKVGGMSYNISSRNLFAGVENWSASDGTWTLDWDEDTQIITMNTNVSSSVSAIINLRKAIKCEAGKTYTALVERCDDTTITVPTINLSRTSGSLYSEGEYLIKPYLSKNANVYTAFTIKGDCELIYFRLDSSQWNNGTVKFRLMVLEGDYTTEKPPFEPYSEETGFRDAKVTAVKSVGVNKWSGKISNKTAPTTYSFENGTLKLTRNGGAIQGCVWSKEKYKAGTYTVSFDASGVSGANFGLCTIKETSATSTGSSIKVWYTNGKQTYTFTLAEDRYIGFYTDGSGVTITASNLIINEGNTALPYSPYTEHTLVIPESVQSLEGYGLGIDDTYYTYLDFENKIFVGICKELTDKTLVNIGNEFSYANITYFALSKSGTVDNGNTGTNILVSNFKTNKDTSNWDDANKIGCVVGGATYNQYWFGFAKGTTLEQAQAIINESEIIVTIADAEEIDISTYITDDNLIGVEGGGTLTFENEYGYAVPSEVTYQIKGGTV